MADTKISDLTAASALTGAELVPVVQSGTTKRATAASWLLTSQSIANANGTDVPIWKVTPATRAPFQVSFEATGPQTDSTWNHWMGFGFNAEVHIGGSAVAAEPALYMAFEDGWYDSADSTDGAEWYVSYYSPAFSDGTRAVQLLRPFYSRIDRGSVATTVAAGSNGVDVATFTGSGTMNVASTTGFGRLDRFSVATSGGTAVVSYTGKTSTTFTGCTTVSGSGTMSTGGAVNGYRNQAVTYCDLGSNDIGTFAVTNGTFKPVFIVAKNSTGASTKVTIGGPDAVHTAAELYFRSAGSQKWGILWNSLAGYFAIRDMTNARDSIEITAGASDTATLTDLLSSLKVRGNLGVFGTTPTTKQTVTGSRGGNAALASLLTGLAAYGLITDSSSA